MKKEEVKFVCSVSLPVDFASGKFLWMCRMKMDYNPQSDLRSRYTPDAKKKRDEELSLVRRKGRFKLIFGSVLIIAGISIMLIEEAFVLAGIIPVYFGLNLAVTGIVNTTKGMDIDEFPKKIEVVFRLLPLLLAALVFLFILNNF